MRVGMNRIRFLGMPAGFRVPHACGDEPIVEYLTDGIGSCSPCVWG
mgnify:CR=1 FL=1